MSASPQPISLDSLFVQHGVASFDKQIYLEAMLGKHRWSFSLNEGTLAFAVPHEPLQLAFQVLGTESKDSNTWLWAWANTESGIPERVLASARDLRTFGIANGIRELTEPELALNGKIYGNRLASIGCGVLRASCYFRIAYAGGSLYMLIKDPKYKRSITRPLHRVARVFPMFLSDYSGINHRLAYLNYLNFYRLRVREDRGGRRVIASHHIRPGAALDALKLEPSDQATELIADFDAADRLMQLSGLAV